MKSPIKRMSPKQFLEKRMSTVIIPKKILPDIMDELIFKETSPDPSTECVFYNKTYNTKYEENFRNN